MLGKIKMIYYMKLHEVGNFNKTKVLKSPIKKSKKIKTFEIQNALYKGREMVLNAFKSEIFPL